MAMRRSCSLTHRTRTPTRTHALAESEYEYRFAEYEYDFSTNVHSGFAGLVVQDGAIHHDQGVIAAAPNTDPGRASDRPSGQGSGPYRSGCGGMGHPVVPSDTGIQFTTNVF